jgi:hypothetical protein
MNREYKGLTFLCLILGALLFMAQSCRDSCTDNDGDDYSVEGENCGMVDCDDTDSGVNPGVEEMCDDGIDNNCDGGIDEGCSMGDDDDDSTTTTTVDPCDEGGTSCGESRFNDNCDGTVSDCETGLIWLKLSTCLGSMEWDAAQPAAAGLSDGDCGVEAGLTDGSSEGDWHVATKEELQGLGSDPPTTWETGYPPVQWAEPGGPQRSPFLYTQGNNFWAADEDASNPDNAWIMSIQDGRVFTADKTRSYFVWPVRGGND